MLDQCPLGFRFSPPALASATAPGRAGAVFRARKMLAGIVHDTVSLEGNPLTFPEVKTLLDGITVGGKKVSDAEQALCAADSWRELLLRVENGIFRADPDTALELHAIAARGEALKWGIFRNGAVRIAGTAMDVPPPEALADLCAAGLKRLAAVDCPHAQGIGIFLFFARNQLFWDCNKRVGRLLMNGVLLSAGHDAINVPAARQTEFNAVMTGFYNTLDAREAFEFMASCSHDETLAFGPESAHAGSEKPEATP